MNAMGYHSMAVHGYSARMFDRVDWYGRIGFDETWFRDQLQGQGLPMCPGPFPGTCDADTSVWIGDQLEKNSDSPQFIYWVTLNSHLPVPIPNLVKDPPSCSESSITAENRAICSWYQLVFNVHRSVSELALRATTRPTIFLIVGDHAPPFSSARLRSQFSDRVVPYVLLVPKRDGTAESPGTTGSLAVVARPAAGARRAHLKKETKLSSSVVGG
jgi:phosphoglycerol transferase MdoB-like AlkP superfamily enzyme